MGDDPSLLADYDGVLVVPGSPYVSMEGALEQADMHFTGFDKNREPRILELPKHRFFLATLDVPQAAHSQTRPYPLLVGFVASCQGRR